MPLVIPDEILKQAKLTEAEARVEIACRLFDAGKLDPWPAAQLAQLERAAFEDELARRGIPIYRPSVDDLQRELDAMDRKLGLKVK